jgi:murein DD-endopeptidase MepM/ murein hydrolase activator NlpD
VLYWCIVIFKCKKGGDTLKRPYKPSLDQFFVKFSKYRQKIDYKDGILCILAFTILTVVTILMSSSNPKVYEVKVGEKSIGYINNYDIYIKAIDNIKVSNIGLDIGNITADKTNKEPSNIKFITSTTIQQAASKELGLSIPSVALYVNGTELAVLSSKADVEKVIEGIKKYYCPKVSDGKIVINSSKIAEKITTKIVASKPKEILGINDAIKKIVNGRGTKKQYAIKNGDTIWDIALSNDLAIEDIKAANPKLNLDKIKIGQKINLAVNLPYVNVKITASIDSKEKIPFEAKAVTDKKLRKGVKKLKVRGKSGLAQIKKNVTIENGNIIDENVVSSKIIVAAKDEVVLVGGKAPVYLATGSFIKPARGILTSGFGRRWGRMHEGIDLAGPTGTPIKAADNGKVTFVGRNYGYGLCVMISHGKGVQTLYGHTSKTYVKVGQTVQKGQKIAAIGSTGHSTGPHVHFEIRKNGTPVNPLAYLR